MKVELLEKAKTFDNDGAVKSLVDETLQKLWIFRKQYPFAENPDSIETLTAEDIFKLKDGEMGDFFHYIEFYLKPLGHLTIRGCTVYQNIRTQIKDFKKLLQIAVDNKKSLAQKVDAPWKEISGLGRDSHIAKKIIFCFNYETAKVVPIFSTEHMEYFYETILESAKFPAQYENFSLGEKYEFLTQELLKAKSSSELTKQWEITFFCRFLYEALPAPKKVTKSQRKKLQDNALLEQQKIRNDFMNLLNELRRKNKISAEQLRDYRDLGFKNPEARQMLTDKLSKLR